MGLQHLPPNFDFSVFHLPRPVDEYIDRCVKLVSTFLSDDEICGCNNGVEGLFALGIYHSCAGKPRSALLAYRRALNIAQLLGLHRDSVRLSRATEEITARSMKQLWCSLVGAERQLSLLLGLPYSTPTDHCGLQISDDEAHLLSPEEAYSRKIAPFVSRLIDRTLSGKAPVLATTQELDEELETIARSLPDSWWEPPPEVGPEKTVVNSDALNRALAHIHHFQFVALLHLPYMLRGDSDRRYQYNRFACLNASREILIRYNIVWRACRTFSCKVIDFQVFTAAVTLLLSLLRQGQVRHLQNEDDKRDWQLVDDLAKTMENLAHDEQLVSTKAAKVIRALQQLCLHPTRDGTKTKLNIPYFGTVDISVTGNVSTGNHQSIAGPITEIEERSHQGTTFPNEDQAFDPNASNSWSSFPFTDFSSNSIWGDGPENTQWGLDNAPFGDYFHLDWNQSWNC